MRLAYDKKSKGLGEENFLFALFAQLVRKHLLLSVLVIVISVLVILSAVGLFSLSSYIIAFCGLAPSIAEIMVPVVGVRFFGILRGLLRYAERMVSHNTTFHLLSELRNWLYEKISSTRSSEILLLDKEDAFTRLIDDIDRLQEFYLRTFNPYITAIVVGTIGVVVLSVNRIGLGVNYAFFYGLAIILLPLIVAGATRVLFHEHIQAVSDSKVILLEIISGLADLSALGALERWKERINDRWKKVYSIERKLGFWKSFSSAVITLCMNYAMLSAVCIAGILLAKNTYPAVMVPVAAFAVFALFEGAQPVAVVLQKIEESRISAQRIYDMSIRCVPENELKEENTHVQPSVTDGMIFDDVSFHYSTGSESLLSNISFTLLKGKKIALVGASGEGKTTLSYLLLGWLSPTQGKISFESDPEHAFSVVNQKVYFFNTSIRNNLKIANIHATEENLWDVIDQVELRSMIEDLPDGLDTELGDGDLKLSGGQRQRLAIARALLRKAPYLVFDEITAGLDVKTEANVMETLLRITKEHGIFVLTHRLIHMESYDEVLVLDKGKICERGTHVELLEKKGVYAAMYRTAQSYAKY